jgi:hypothetical protein
MTADWVNAIGEVSGAFFTACAFFVAWYQLSKINKSIKIAADENKVNSLQVVLAIETQMNERKVQFDTIATDIRRMSESTATVNENNVAILTDSFNSAKENYFNALDRLCFCINKGYINERDWKIEYRNMLMNTIKSYESDFLEASPYRHIKDLNRKWQSE